jgi:hypothetical protein
MKKYSSELGEYIKLNKADQNKENIEKYFCEDNEREEKKKAGNVYFEIEEEFFEDDNDNNRNVKKDSSTSDENNIKVRCLALTALQKMIVENNEIKSDLIENKYILLLFFFL